MSEITVNELPLLRATIHMPLAGVWSADVEVDTADELVGAATVSIDGTTTFRGTVVDGGVTHGLWRGRIVGGAAGLRGTIPARAYRNATLADVLHDAIVEAGEALDASSGDLGISAALFHRTEAAAARAVQAIANAAGFGWRVLPGGAVWIGAETWPDAGSPDLTLLESDPRERRYRFGGDVLGLRPGTLLQFRDEAADVFLRLGTVRLDVEAHEFTATVWQAA